MLKRVATYILLGCIFLLFFNAWLYYQQPNMIFYPYTHLTSTPDDWGIRYEEVLLRTSDDVQLHGWYLPSKSSEQVVLFFHGNAGNISHRGESLRIFHELDFNVLIFDYRGYGQSQGESSEHGLYLDAMAAW
ncbi:MAG: alpha/beta hydrolase, partial [Thioalkalispiraceae bacterium]